MERCGYGIRILANALMFCAGTRARGVMQHSARMDERLPARAKMPLYAPGMRPQAAVSPFCEAIMAGGAGWPSAAMEMCLPAAVKMRRYGYGIRSRVSGSMYYIGIGDRG